MAAKKGFRLSKQDVQFTHINQRLENHGPNEKVTGVDLSFSLDMENDVLEALAPGLRDSFYTLPAKGDGDLVDKAKANEPIRLRYPELSPQSWSKELPNYEVIFHYGLEGNNDVVLEDCTIKSIKIEMHDGGTVGLAWKVGAHPTDEQVGRLAERLRTGLVSLSMEHKKPKAKPQGELEGVPPAATNEPEPNPLDRAANDADDDDDDDEDQAPRGRGGRRRVMAGE